MRALAGVLILVVLAMLGVWLFHSGRGAPALQPAPEASAQRARAEQPLSTTPVDTQETATESSRQSAKEAPVAVPPAVPCAVFGRVVDEGDQAVADARVRLAGYKRWAAGVEVPRLPGPVDMRGWEIVTDAQGGFRFEVPLPTVESASFTIQPDAFHDSVREFMGGSYERARAPLHAGDNDLGVFRLATTGAIRGRVTDEKGSPLEDAHLRIGSDRATTFERDAASDAGGNYEIQHIKEGSYGVNAECKGYLSDFKIPFEVQRRQVTGPVDFVLRAAPVLGGVVVDDAGHGLEGARLWGWPSTSGAGAGVKSAADGSFTISLPQDEPYTLEVKLDGFDTFGLDDRATHYKPNTRDLRIVLKRSEAASTRFVVVDDSTGAKIETFGLEVERDRGSRSESSSWTDYRAHPKPVAHAGGEVEVPARPGLDLYTVIAPGYVRKSGDVAHESKDSPRQLVKLARGGTLTGRATFGRQPVPGATLRLAAGSMQLPDTVPEGSKETRVFRAERSSVQQLATGTDGRFRFESLDPGTYRLLLNAASGESLELVPLNIPNKGDTDLGDLELVKGATIVGQVLVPPGRPRQGLAVFLDDWRSGNKQVSDAEGRFRFQGVTAGQHSLTLEEVPGILAEGAATLVTLGAGETREVVIDARDRGMCKVVLTIEIPGQPVEGLEVMFLPAADPAKRLSLGRTDAQGRVAGSVLAAGNASVEVELQDWTPLRHPSAIVALVLDHDVEATVRFEVGRVRFELPSSVQLPADGSATLEFAGETNPSTRQIPLWAKIGANHEASRGMELEADGRHFLTNLVLAGNLDADFAIQSDDAAAEPHEVYRSPVHVLVRAGETTDAPLH